MRHIPEDELHSYLDQALSRTQCVEIESHLAGCEGCRLTRDGIAALRDRTTALLAALAPPRGFMPAVDLLRERAAARSARLHRRRRAAAWAASLVVALGLGWWANTYVSRPSAVASRLPVTAPSPAARHADTAARIAMLPAARNAGRPAADRGPAGAMAVSTESAALRPTTIAAPRVELSTGTLPTGEFETSLGGIWRTLSWAGARDERGDSVPHIDGLPVVEVQVGQAKVGGNKSIMVVAQQLASGDVIRTIEGPAADVSQLLSSRPGASNPSPWPTLDSPGIAGGDGTMAMRHGDRMLAITAPLPNDSLRAMMRRLNAEMRGK